MNKKLLKKQEKLIRVQCPYCFSPLKEELGVKKCENENCSFKEIKRLEQVKLIK